jgi:predicted lipoprotein with Yx(FWY)xxD motif
MPKAALTASEGRRAPGRRRRGALGLLAAGALLLALAAATALAAQLALTVGSSANAALGERVVVNPQGRTLYTLSPETTRHLLCRTSRCLRLWPPLTVGSARTKLKNGPGLQGRLAVMRRANGTLQVTLRGLPLYRYSGDHARGQVAGQGLESFGGTWHAAPASSGERSRAPAAPAAPGGQAPAPGSGESTSTAPSYYESAPMTPGAPATPTPATAPPPSTAPAPPPPPPYTPPPYTPPPYPYPPY